MKTSDFSFDLPESLIAQKPLQNRTQSRLLHVDRASRQFQDQQFTDLLELLNPNDLLVFNNSKVMRARLYGQKITGGQVELLIERILDNQTCLAHMRVAKKPKPGQFVLIDDEPVFEMLGREDDLFLLKFHSPDLATYQTAFDYVEARGHIPLPPYIGRAETQLDDERYQTVYAKDFGSVAAPTAGLHFDEAFLDKIKSKGVQTAEVTLHVGAGTFQPVRVDDVTQHRMHSELIHVSAEVCDLIHTCKSQGGRVIAVGTTVVRSLESAAKHHDLLKPYAGETDIFIYPGYEFKVVDAMLTNFHLPESTLLMLISAFADKALIEQAYQHAIKAQYRFFSYGDAMFIS